jgi:hypothetical protein
MSAKKLQPIVSWITNPTTSCTPEKLSSKKKLSNSRSSGENLNLGLPWSPAILPLELLELFTKEEQKRR